MHPYETFLLKNVRILILSRKADFTITQKAILISLATIISVRKYVLTTLISRNYHVI